MIALRSENPPDLEAVTRRFASIWNSAALNEPPQKGDAAAVVQIAGGSVGFGFMPMPIPWGDLDWPVRTAWSWPEAEAELRQHRAHLLVFASSATLSMVQLTLALTAAIASSLADTDAIAVYYGNASIVLPEERYREAAIDASETELPILLWLGFHPLQENNAATVYTTGMKALGYLDLEVSTDKRPVSALLDLVANVAHYQLAAAIQLDDGETIGSSEEERLRVTHAPSRFGTREISCHIHV